MMLDKRHHEKAFIDSVIRNTSITMDHADESDDGTDDEPAIHDCRDESRDNAYWKTDDRHASSDDGYGKQDHFLFPAVNVVDINCAKDLIDDEHDPMDKHKLVVLIDMDIIIFAL